MPRTLGTTDSLLLQAAAAIGPLARERAAEIDRTRAVPIDLIDSMRRDGLFHLNVPTAIGGQQAHPVTTARVIEEVSAADGSTGWCIMIAAQNAAFSGFAAVEAAQAVWGSSGIVAGVARPIGRAVPVAGGYRVTGRWPFASGSSHADWFIGECMLYEEGAAEPRREPDGGSRSYMALVPRSQVTIHDTWDTIGLRGTASNDFSIDGVFVPESFAIPMIPEPWDPWPFFKSLALVFTTHGAQALGLGRAAVDATIEMARSKIGWGTTRPIAEQTRLQHVVAESLVLVEAAREHLHGAIDRHWEASANGEPLGRLNGRVRLATSHAATSSLRAVDLLHRAMSTSSILTKSPLDRLFRDMHAAAAHVMVGPLTYEAAGRVEMGLPAGMAFFE